MTKIRKLYYFDKKNTQEMISFLNDYINDNYVNKVMFNPFLPLHHLLPLKFKFLPESYILKRENYIRGLITIAPVKSRDKKMEIQKLFFEENSYAEAFELVQYAVSKYKAMGAPSIMVKVDDYLSDLITMFISKCGFSQISNEKIWRITQFSNTPFNEKEFRNFRNSDAKAVAELYNNLLLPHFRPLFNLDKTEFKEDLLKGLAYYSEYKYIIENNTTGDITGCIIIIKTSDNENFIIDIIQSDWMESDINPILNFISQQIKKRKKRFGMFIRTKHYTSIGDKYEKQFIENGFECVQNQIILTNSSARVLKEPFKNTSYTMLTDLLTTKPAPTH